MAAILRQFVYRRMDHVETGPVVRIRQGVRIVDMDSLWSCPMPKKCDRLPRDTQSNQAMDMSYFHGQEEISWCWCVVDKVRGLVWGEVNAEAQGS